MAALPYKGDLISSDVPASTAVQSTTTTSTPNLENNSAKKDAKKEVAPENKLRNITSSELSKHNKPTDAWIAIDNK